MYKIKQLLTLAVVFLTTPIMAVNTPQTKGIYKNHIRSIQVLLPKLTRQDLWVMRKTLLHSLTFDRQYDDFHDALVYKIDNPYTFAENLKSSEQTKEVNPGKHKTYETVKYTYHAPYLYYHMKEALGSARKLSPNDDDFYQKTYFILQNKWLHGVDKEMHKRMLAESNRSAAPGCVIPGTLRSVS